MSQQRIITSNSARSIMVCAAFCIVVACCAPTGYMPCTHGLPFPSVCWSPFWGCAYETPAWEAEVRAKREAEWNAGLIERQMGPWRFHHVGGGRVIAVCYPGLFGNLVLLCGGIIVARRVEGALRRRRDPRCRPGHCHACGYDLRGNASGTCPECGTPTARSDQSPPC